MAVGDDSSKCRLKLTPYGDVIMVLRKKIIFVDENGNRHIIPIGFESAGLYVPRLLWRLLEPITNKATQRPSFILEFRYQNSIGSREQTEKMYRKQLLKNKHPVWKVFLVYWGLRFLGALNWKNQALK